MTSIRETRARKRRVTGLARRIKDTRNWEPLLKCDIISPPPHALLFFSRFSGFSRSLPSTPGRLTASFICIAPLPPSPGIHILLNSVHSLFVRRESGGRVANVKKAISDCVTPYVIYGVSESTVPFSSRARVTYSSSASFSKLAVRVVIIGLSLTFETHAREPPVDG